MTTPRLFQKRGNLKHTHILQLSFIEDIDPVSPTVSEPLNLLATFLDSGLGYNAIRVARSAVSSYLVLKDGVPFGQQKLVIRFIKGVFEMKPALPKYSNTWNVGVVLNYLELLHPHNKLTLKELSQKLAMLLALLSGQRCQTIIKLSLSSMKLSSSTCVFQITSLLKQSRRGHHSAPFELMAYPGNSKLCIVAVLREYLA